VDCFVNSGRKLVVLPGFQHGSQTNENCGPASRATAMATASTTTTSQVLKSYSDAATVDTETVVPPEVQGRSYKMTDSSKRDG